MIQENFLQKFAALPHEAQQQFMDFMDFLTAKYSPLTTHNEKLIIERIVEKDGKIDVKTLAYGNGQKLKTNELPQAHKSKQPCLTVGDFKKSGLIGIWKDRNDIRDSAVYSRQLRDKAQWRIS